MIRFCSQFTLDLAVFTYDRSKAGGPEAIFPSISQLHLLNSSANDCAAGERDE
jgi:hypothetical protein